MIRLDRTYPIPDQHPDGTPNWGLELWKLLRRHTPGDVPSLLRNPEETQHVTERVVNYTLVRLVNRSRIVLRDCVERRNSEDELYAAMNEAVGETVDVGDALKNRITWFLVRICRRVVEGRSSSATDPVASEPLAATVNTQVSNSRKAKIRSFARVRQHRCRYCGCFLDHEGAADADRSPSDGAVPVRCDDADLDVTPKHGAVAFIQQNPNQPNVEHLFPRAMGGGHEKSNLTLSCRLCNAMKLDRMTFADFAIESVQERVTTRKGLERVFDGRKVFPLLWRQGGACALCGKAFHDRPDSRLFLKRRDMRDAHHFYNLEIICGPCGEDHEQDTVRIRD